MTTSFQKKKLYYTVSGKESRPIVLVHGFLESAKIWDDLDRELSPHRQVIRLDLPGHGASENIAEVHSMELFAEAVNHVLKILNISRADILGHSMGGYVALAFLELFPEKTNSISLLNSTSRSDNEERREIRDRSSQMVVRNKEAYVRMAISNLLSTENNKKFHRELELLKEQALKFPTEGIIAALQGMKIRTDRTPVLKRFSGGKFIMAGSEDPLLPFNELKDLATETGCGLYSFPDGHLTYMENRERFHEIVHFIE